MGNMESGQRNRNINNNTTDSNENVVTVDEVVAEVSKFPVKLFGGQAIENDASMHQIRNDLLSFDESIKRLFRRKKNIEIQNDIPSSEEYYYEDQESMPANESNDIKNNNNYLQPTFLDRHVSPSSMPITESMNEPVKYANKIIWRCTNCTAENKITERACRRCHLTETKL